MLRAFEFGPAGTRVLAGPRAGFAPPTGRAHGNQLPANTGLWPSTYYGEEDKPGPSVPTASPIGGTAGAGNDGFFGTDPRAPMLPASPRVWIPQPEGGNRANPAVMPRNQVVQQSYGRPGVLDRSELPGLLPTVNGPAAVGRVTDVGIIGWNDQRWCADRHAYWDTGTKKTGVTPSVPGTPPNPVTDGPARPDLRTVNRSLTWQQGSDNTRNQDDLTRPYTWLGEQGSGWAPVWGGAPGTFEPYGTRGGIPYPIQAAVPEGEPGDGPARVFAGPPHGLHSFTLSGRWQSTRRYMNTKQMTPVRIDRPSNSPQAGQSYSQTVQSQGGPPRNIPRGAVAAAVPMPARRGWAGWQNPSA
jgi:hypothetical protein